MFLNLFGFTEVFLRTFKMALAFVAEARGHFVSKVSIVFRRLVGMFPIMWVVEFVTSKLSFSRRLKRSKNHYWKFAAKFVSSKEAFNGQNRV